MDAHSRDAAAVAGDPAPSPPAAGDELAPLGPAEPAPRRSDDEPPVPARDWRAPIWVVGAPRSGTTFVVEMLNRHPEVFVTNETRIMTYVRRALHKWPDDAMALSQRKQEVLDSLRRQMPDIVRSVFTDLGCPPDVRWGDKNPHYADPVIDPGLLDMIDEFFPDSQYVHVVRDGRDAAASMVGKGWVDIDEAVDTWNRHVSTARSFGHVVTGLDRYLEIRYEDLIDDGHDAAEELFDFLRLEVHDDVRTFLARQAERRTPFSGPISAVDEIGRSAWRDRIPEERHSDVTRGLADRLVELGYEDQAWRRALYRPSAAGSRPPGG